MRRRPPVSVPYTSLSTGPRLDTFGMKLRHPRWSGASGTRRSKAAVRGWISRRAKRPSWFQSDEACRSVIGETRPPARRCFAKPTHRDCTAPPTLGPNCRLQLEYNRSKRVSITGPRCKNHCRDLQGRTIPLYLNQDRSGGEQPAVTDAKPNSVVPATIDIIEIVNAERTTRIVTGRPSPMSSICDRLHALAPPARSHRLNRLRTPQYRG